MVHYAQSGAPGGLVVSIQDTICAVATAPGRGGIGVIRLSGPQALGLACCLTQREALTPRLAHRVRLYQHDQILDDGLALFFPGPASFTGEDVVELQGHGSPVVLNALVQALCELGARRAEPGEFSMRAFLNDRIDLAQAEAIADLINARTLDAARSASRSLQGEFSQALQQLATQMLRLRVWVEAALDFPEEDIDFLSDQALLSQIDALDRAWTLILQRAAQGVLQRDGVEVVLIGRPNAGKSSLLNALTQADTAIVTEVAGTTRDAISVPIEIDGLAVTITDTAGLRDSDDPIEQEGIRRAKNALLNADLVLMLCDAREPETLPLLLAEVVEVRDDLPQLAVFNKIDLLPPNVSNKTDLMIESPLLAAHPEALLVSLKQDRGMSALRQAIAHACGREAISEVFSARARHIDCLQRAHQHFVDAKVQLLQYAAGELMAEELLQSHQVLGEITGRMSADDLLGEIFGSFCIGK